MTRDPEHWDAVVRHYCFRKVPEEEINSEIRQRTTEVASFVCADLRLRCPPRIVWIRPLRTAEIPRTTIQEAVLEERKDFPRLRRDIRGGYTPCCPNLNEIWLRADLQKSPDLEFVVAHELRHAWQKLTCPDVFDKDCEAEGDAYPYGYAVLKQWLTNQGTLTPAVSANIDRMCAEKKVDFLKECPHVPFRALETARAACDLDCAGNGHA